MNIRPASDLKYKLSEIENLAVNEEEVVYLTNNGYGSMVLMSLEKYTKLLSEKELEDKKEELAYVDKKILDKEIEEKLLKSEEDYKNGRVRKAEDVFKEWEAKYGI